MRRDFRACVFGSYSREPRRVRAKESLTRVNSNSRANSNRRLRFRSFFPMGNRWWWRFRRSEPWKSMSHFNQVLWALDKELEPREFERLSLDLLGREGYFQMIPLGGQKDNGRDAKVRTWSGKGERGSLVVFQFSMQRDWERKLRQDVQKVRKTSPEVTGFVFVSTQEITAARQDKLRKELQDEFGWSFTVYAREWLRHRLCELHQDLAKKYLGIELPPTLGQQTSLTSLVALERPGGDWRVACRCGSADPTWPCRSPA